ncbi:MAG TPA: glutathione S-transferase, partial [Pseudomonas pachastrellae]|nr:glutathione S-transferase [Halopseudomonas pachastrellae]
KLGWEVPEGRERMVGYGSFEDTLATVQQALLGGPWLCGNHFTAADLYLAAQLGWAMSEGIVPERPGFAEFVTTAFERPAAIRAKAFNDQYMAGNSP